MTLLVLLAALAMSYHFAKAKLAAMRKTAARETSVLFRMAMFSWVLGLVFLAAFLFLPNKQRLLILVPASFAAVMVAKVWKSAQLRARQADQGRVDFERMKRVSSPRK